MEVSVGGIGVLIAVSVGISELVRITGTINVSPGAGVLVKGRVRMTGVAVTIMGVREGIVVKIGNV
jgi:hypothetical protein